MILTRAEILKGVSNGTIVLEPFAESQLNPNSYNYRLGDSLRVLVSEQTVDPRQNARTHELRIPESGMVFMPGRVHLGHTLEVIGSESVVPVLIGRSSLGRLGVFLQISADLGQLGAIHRWTLEIVVAQPIRLYPRMLVGQVSFWKTYGDACRYEGYLGRHSLPTVPVPSSFA